MRRKGTKAAATTTTTSTTAVKRKRAAEKKSEVSASAPVDVFDVDAYGEEEFGPEPEVKKKKKRVNRRKKADPYDIMLTFGSQRKQQPVRIRKGVENLMF